MSLSKNKVPSALTASGSEPPPARRFQVKNESRFRRRDTDPVATQLEIYKFVVPILMSLIGFMLYYELNSIKNTASETSNKIETISGNIAGMAQQINGVQQNMEYDRQRLDRMEDQRYPAK